jgi:eukaryotic-like serine/threonine-protein kinase
VIGQTISHYKILEKLGEGGMGVVYKAHDTKLDRDVALKFLPASLVSSPEEIERFEREAKAISALNHTNIATIYDIDQSEDKKFLVLEYIAGGTLKSRLKKLKSEDKELAISDVIDYGIQIAEGLAHAHRHQIVHRDIKSDNVMLTEEGKVKITDFGLAKLRGDTQLTKTGSTIGTLAYMAPEQLRGEDIDRRADLFSLGVVLYEITTSRLPFRGEHEAALTYSIANEEPAPIRSLRQNLPEALDRVITKCLQKDRALRYQHADEVVEDLRTLHHETTGTVKTVIVKERSKLPWIIAAASVTLIAAALYLFMPSSHPAGPNGKTIAVLPFENLTEQKEDEYFSEGITDDILTQLSKIADLKVISRTSVVQYKGTKKTIHDIGKELNAGVILEGSVRRAENQIRIVAQLIDANSDEHLWADTYDREYKQVFAIQTEIAQKIAASLQAKLSASEKERLANPATTNPEAYNAYLQGRYFYDRRSKEDAEKAIGYYEQTLRIDPNYAPAWEGLSLAHAHQGELGYVPIDEGFRKARREAEKALELDPNLAEAHSAMGWIKRIYDWDWTGADAAYKRALELEPANADAVRGTASLAATLGRFDEAITLDHRAIELDPLRAATQSNLGLQCYYAGRWEEAQGAVRKALELNPQFPAAHYFLGRIRLAQSKTEDALSEMQRESEPVWRDQGLVLAYHAAGKKKEADAALAEYIEKFQNESAYQIAEIYAYRGEKDKTFEWLERAFKQRDGGLSEIKGDPLLRNIETDPRYAEFMKKMKLPL